MKCLKPALALLLLLAFAGAALAHAFLDHASPAVGSTVHGSPAELELWFTEPVELGFSSVKVVDGQGQPVDKGDLSLDSGDKQHLHLGLTSLAPGKYKVTWRVVSVDTHKTNGSFSFTVAP